MKRLYTPLIAVLFTMAAFSQTFLTEDFGGATFPPSGWFNLPVRCDVIK